MGLQLLMEVVDIFPSCAELIARLRLCDQMNNPGVMPLIRLGTVEVTARVHSEQYYPRRFVPG